MVDGVGVLEALTEVVPTADLVATTTGVVVLAYTGALVGTTTAEVVTGWTTVQGQLVMVKVVASETVMVLPLTTTEVAYGQ
jgi:hypothetical protein